MIMVDWIMVSMKNIKMNGIREDGLNQFLHMVQCTMKPMLLLHHWNLVCYSIKVKSQLKIIEAGIHKCPVIASNYGPYTLDIEDGKHGFLINEKW